MIGGNTIGTIQTQTTTKNSFGSPEKNWEDVISLTGFLDYVGGDGAYKSNYKGAIAETTHLFICDYVAFEVTPTTTRMLINGERYDILKIDNPMNLDAHLEIMLKYNEVVN